MDHRDAMSEFGTYLKSLPDFEMDQERMEATFVESGEDRDVDSPPERERSRLELLGDKLDNLIASNADRLSDRLKPYTDTPWHGFSKHLLQPYCDAVSPSGKGGDVSLRGALLNSLRKRTTAHFIRAYFRISNFGRDGTDWKTKMPRRSSVQRMSLEISLGAQHWLVPEGKTWREKYWPKRFVIKLMVNDETIGGHGWHFKAPFQFSVTGLDGIHTLAEVGRRINRRLYGEVTPQDFKPQLEAFLSTREHEVENPNLDFCDRSWFVSDEVLAEARKELGDWVLHFLYLEDKVHTIHLEWDVCGTCGGKGKHVNPSIDAGGLTHEDMYEAGPDFEEEYFSGVYDVKCYECGGRTTSPVVDTNRTPEETTKYMNSYFEDEANHRAEVAAERRMGC